MFKSMIFALVLPELRKMDADPSYNINLSGDLKQMLQELGTEKGRQAALHGGGGNKAQNERAAALAAILSSRSNIKEDSKSSSTSQSYSIVDAASASVHGRTAAAAKAASGDKTAARIAVHMAGERMPVNAKLVSFQELKILSLVLCCDTSLCLNI